MDNKHKFLKRFLALVLSAAMIITYMPVSLIAYAEGETAQPAAAEQVKEEAPAPAPEAEPAPEPEPEPEPEPAPTVKEEAPAQPAAETAEPKAPAEEQTGEQTQVTPEQVEKEEAPKEPEEPEEPAYPAATLRGAAGGVDVEVNAPEGALPEGTELKVRAIGKSDAVRAAEDATGVEISDAKAVELSLTSDGKSVQPEKEVEVTISADGFDSDADQELFTVEKSGKAHAIKSAVDGKASFSTKQLNTVGIAQSVETYTVNFYASETDTEPYVTEYKEQVEGQTLGSLPADPGKENATFQGWYYKDGDDEVVVTSETPVTSDMNLYAKYKDLVSVTFVVPGEGSEETVVVSKYDLVEGTTIGTLPQAPFKENCEFENWVDEDGNEVTANTIVPDGGMTVYATFKTINIYTLTVRYYYMVDADTRVDFEHEVFHLEDKDLENAFTLNAPKSTVAEQIPGSPLYYPATPSIQITEEDFAEGKEIEREIEYVEYTADYDFVYYLKNLEGDGYTEIERESIKGVLNSEITPTVKEYSYAKFERLETKLIDAAEGIEVPVYYTRKDFTLKYNSNGGNFIQDTTAPYGSTIIVDKTPTRTGYSFDGWYKDADLTEPAGNSVTLNEDITLYAKWKGENVGYTIVYLKEKYNPDGENEWVYDRSRTATGEVGSEVIATNAPDISNNLNGYEKDTERNAASKVTIAADGSTVLTVYYKLIRYTLVFNLNNNNGRITIGGQTYTGSNYRVQNVVLGQDISSMWPSSSNEVYRTDNRYFQYWTGAGNYVTKRYELIYDDVENANSNHVMTFTASWSATTADRDAQYYLQQPDGTYEIENAYTQTGLNTTSLVAKDIDGYTKHSGTPTGYTDSGDTTYEEEIWIEPYDDTISFNDSTYREIGSTYTFQGRTYTIKTREARTGCGQSGYAYTATAHIEGHKETRTVTKYTYRFYYDRAKYHIEYYDGGTKLNETEQIFYEADITDAKYNYTPEKPAGKEDYTWGGWFADSALQQQYTFSTMPGNDLLLYAKWIAPQYTVSFDSNGGSSSFDDQSVEKGKTASFPGDAVRTNYNFLGWYTEPDGGSRYNWDAPITNDITLYAHWEQKTLSYTVHYYKAGTTEPVAADKIVTNPVFEEGETITENAVAVTGFKPDKSSSSIELSFEGENEIIFYYAEKSDFTEYTVRYVLKDHPDIEVHAPRTEENVDGSTVSVYELAAPVNKDYMRTQTSDEDILRDDYYPEKASDELILSSNIENNVLTFYYINYNKAKITVNYLDMDGNPIKDSQISYVSVGETFQVNRTAPNGYIYHHNIDSNNESKTLYTINTGDPLTINVYYQRKLRIIATGDSKVYDGEPLTKSFELDGLDGVTVSGLSDGHLLSTVQYEGSQTDVGSSKVIPYDAVITGADGSVVHEDYYAITYVPGELIVNKANVTIIVEADRWNDGYAYDGTARTIGFRHLKNGTTDSQGHDGVIINNPVYENLYGDTIRNALKGIERTETDAGFYTISWDTVIRPVIVAAGVLDDENFEITLTGRDGELTIPKRNITVRTGSAEKLFDGTALTKDEASAIIDKSSAYSGNTLTQEERQIDVAATGSQTPVGSSSNTYTIEWGTVNENNYNLVEDLGTLKVNENNTEITFTAPSDTKVYDGTPLEADGSDEDNPVTASGIPEGLTYTATATGSATNVTDDGINVVSSYQILDEDGNDVTSSFTNINTVNGKLEVTKKAVSLESEKLEKVYDGAALVNGDTALKTETGWITGEGVTYTFTGSRTDVGGEGKKENTFTYEANDGTNLDNYEITETFGDLVITPRPITVTITGNKDSKTYNGKEQSVEGYEVEISDPLYTEGDFTFDGEAVAKGTDVDTYPMGLEEDQFENTNENFTVTFSVTDGELEITRASATVTAVDAGKTYGDADPALTATVEGIVDGLELVYEVAREAGENVGTYTITPSGDAEQGNYTVEYKTGTFTISKKAITVKITGHTGGDPYTGSEQSVDGYDVEIPEGVDFTEGDIDFSGTDEVKGTDAGTYDMGLDESQFANTNNNYDVTFEVTDGKLTIDPASIDPENPDDPSDSGRIEVTDPEDTTYNGVEQKQSVTITDNKTGKTLTEGEDYDITYTDATNAGTVTVTITGKGNYKGTFTRTYEINRAPVTVTTGSASKPYDGKPLTNDEGNIEGLVNGETATITVTGSQTEIGSSDNSYEIDWGSTNPDNYEITENLGTLTVTEREDAEIIYDLNGGSYNGSTDDIVETHKVGDVISIHEAPVREGYVFSYWKGSAYQPGDSYEVTGDHTFTAIWVAIEKTDSDGKDTDKGVKTGDEADLTHWLILMLLAGAGFGGIGYGRRRREDEE